MWVMGILCSDQAKCRQWMASYSKCQVIAILLPHKLIVHTIV